MAANMLASVSEVDAYTTLDYSNCHGNSEYHWHGQWYTVEFTLA